MEEEGTMKKTDGKKEKGVKRTTKKDAPPEAPQAPEIRETVVHAPVTLSTVDIHREAKRIAAQAKKGGWKKGRTISSDILGSVEVAMAGDFLMLSLTDHKDRSLMVNRDTMGIESDSEQEKVPDLTPNPENGEGNGKKAKAPKAPRTKKEKPPKPEPVWVEQLDPKGNTERVDKNHYCNQVVCECGNIRYVANADRFLVTRCKPCQRKHVKGKVRDKQKAKRKEKGVVVRGALQDYAQAFVNEHKANIALTLPKDLSFAKALKAIGTAFHALSREGEEG